MADGAGGSVGWVSPGYDEPPRDQGNQMNTDYSENEKAKERMARGFRDRRNR